MIYYQGGNHEKRFGLYTFVLQVDVTKTETQDVAVILLNKEKGKVSLQVVGDEELYGKDYVIEPKGNSSVTANPGYTGSDPVTVNVAPSPTTTVVVQSAPIVQYVYSPAYVPYYPPYYYGYYPPYFAMATVIAVGIYRSNNWYHHGGYYGGHYHGGNNNVVINTGNRNQINHYNYSRNPSNTVSNNLAKGIYGNRTNNNVNNGRGNGNGSRPSSSDNMSNNRGNSNRPSTSDNSRGNSNRPSSSNNMSSNRSSSNNRPSTSNNMSSNRSSSNFSSGSSRSRSSGGYSGGGGGGMRGGGGGGEGDDKYSSTLSEVIQNKKGCRNTFGQPFFIIYSYLLLKWHIRSAHISEGLILAICFFKQHHIIPGINGCIGRIRYCIVANFYNLVSII